MVLWRLLSSRPSHRPQLTELVYLRNKRGREIGHVFRNPSLEGGEAVRQPVTVLDRKHLYLQGWESAR
jgi:hypothetical protein